MKCETQQAPISKQVHNSFFFLSDWTPAARGSVRVKLHWNDECRMSIDEWWIRFRLRLRLRPDTSLSRFKLDRIP